MKKSININLKLDNETLKTEAEVPVTTSDLTNDSGFITKEVNNLTNYTLTSNLSTIATTGNLSDAIEDSNHQSISSTLKEQITINQNNISSINSKIPDAATSSNQLADKAFVNSSIATNTATFKGTLDIITDLELSRDATHTQVIAALNSHVFTTAPTNNDYCFVSIPDAISPSIVSQYDRYKYDSNDSTWLFEFTLNNSSFTASQWASINSGLTSNDKTKVDAIILNGAGNQFLSNDGTYKQIPVDNTTITRNGNTLQSVALHIGDNPATTDISGTTWQFKGDGQITLDNVGSFSNQVFSIEGSVIQLVTIIVNPGTAMFTNAAVSNGVTYAGGTWNNIGTAATLPPKITFTSGSICTDLNFINWLNQNATQVINSRTLTGQQIADKIDIISTSGAGTQYLANDGTYKEIDLSSKQDVLTAGTNITINNNVISATIPTTSRTVKGGVYMWSDSQGYLHISTSEVGLETPTISLSGSTLSIQNVEGAESYDIYVDGTFKTNVQRSGE